MDGGVARIRTNTRTRIISYPSPLPCCCRMWPRCQCSLRDRLLRGSGSRVHSLRRRFFRLNCSAGGLVGLVSGRDINRRRGCCRLVMLKLSRWIVYYCSRRRGVGRYSRICVPLGLHQLVETEYGESAQKSANREVSRNGETGFLGLRKSGSHGLQ